MTKREIPAWMLGDSGWRGAWHILTCPLLEHKGVLSFVDLQKHTFRYDLMLERCRGFSSGEYLMLEMAAALFNEEPRVNLWNVVNTLSHNNVLVILEAIAIAAGMPASQAGKVAAE